MYLNTYKHKYLTSFATIGQIYERRQWHTYVSYDVRTFYFLITINDQKGRSMLNIISVKTGVFQ